MQVRRQRGRVRTPDRARTGDVVFCQRMGGEVWPIVLPAQITLAIMTTFVVAATVVAALLRSKPGTVFWYGSGIAFVVFIPSCTGLMSVLDARRFGVFHYASYSDVQDFRIKQFLPPAAKAITLERTVAGHQARYTISKAELLVFLNELWNTYGKYSAIPDGHFGDGTPLKTADFQHEFDDLDWPPLQNAVRYYSPAESDGAGAAYYFDPTTGTSYHRAGYW